jgi:hypothetical protein
MATDSSEIFSARLKTFVYAAGNASRPRKRTSATRLRTDIAFLWFYSGR